MQSIQVKGINDYLLFKFNDEVSIDQCLMDLETLLCSPSFKKEDFFSKGYFELGKREWTEEIFEKIMNVLKRTKTVLFCGIEVEKKEEKQLKHCLGIIRNGEVIKSDEDLLFEGKINPGGHLVVHGRTYVLGKCLGTIEVLGKDASINVSNLKHACLMINDKRIEDISVDQLTVFYDDGKKIRCKSEGGRICQEQSL